jgi:hypothetical protein
VQVAERSTLVGTLDTMRVCFDVLSRTQAHLDRLLRLSSAGIGDLVDALAVIVPVRE